MASDTQPQQLATGLLRSYAAGGRVVIYTLSSLSNDTVDVWVASCLAEMETCIAEDRPLLVLQDLARPTVVQTPYSREQGNTVTHSYPELGGRIAFMLQHNTASQRVGRYVKGQNHEYRERQIFTSREDALAWLMELVPSDAE